MSLDTYTSRTYQLNRTWQQFWNVFQLYSHQERLEGLKVWAKRKKLQGVYLHYNNLHTDMEMLLSAYQIRSPHLTFWTSIIHEFIAQIQPEPRYYKGYARRYSQRGKVT